MFTFTNIHKKYNNVIVHCGTQTRLVESTGACKNVITTAIQYCSSANRVEIPSISTC